MSKLTTAAAPDFTKEEKRWLDQHPGFRMVLFIVRLAIVPAALALISGYYSARVGKTEKKSSAGYQVTRDAMEDLQAQVKALSDRVEVMQQLFLVSIKANGGGAAPVVTAPPLPAAGHTTKPPAAPEVKKAVERLKAEAAKPLPSMQKPIPKSLEDAVQQVAK